jgi:hypothetical protein
MPVRVRLGVLAVALILATSGVGGCGGKELKTAEEARQYILDVLHGKAAEWEGLAADASLQAKLAWQREAKIRSFEQRLRSSAEWACEAAEWAEKVDEAYGYFQDLPLEQREELLRYYGFFASSAEVEAVIDETLSLGAVEVVLVTGEVCSL